TSVDDTHSTPCSLLYITTASTEIYTLSLHDALPISRTFCWEWKSKPAAPRSPGRPGTYWKTCSSRPWRPWPCRGPRRPLRPTRRSEEHTSELQSRENLVCRLLLEKKKKQTNVEQAMV